MTQAGADDGREATPSPSARIATIDGLRGFAVMGILVMNIVGMAMPAFAYVDPFYYGGASGGDLIAWAGAYALADGKMRMIFSMLFGASAAIVADAAVGRSPGPVALHYRRLFWLALFGMLHAWLIWYGDILVEYAIGGAILFAAWRWRPSALAAAAALMFLLSLSVSLVQWHDAALLRSMAERPDAPDEAIDAWAAVLDYTHPEPSVIAEELALYRGDFADAFRARAPLTGFFQADVIWTTLPSTLFAMLLGLLLYRTGFLAGDAPRRLYWRVLALGYGIALPLYLPLMHWLVASRFDPVAVPLADALSLLLRPFVALAHVSAVILFLRSGRAGWLADRLVAAGRMAFSNYLGTSLAVTTLFYGYGGGLFGRLSRAELWWVILPVWTLILLWSHAWLSRYRFGPLEWLWRSLARWSPQPMRRTA